MSKKPAKLGSVWAAGATFYNHEGKRIAKCVDAPNPIAAKLCDSDFYSQVSTIKTLLGWKEPKDFDKRIAMLNKPENHEWRDRLLNQ